MKKETGRQEKGNKKGQCLKILWNAIQIGSCYCSVAHSCMWLKEISIHNHSVAQWPWKYLKNTLSSWSTFLFCITKCSRSLYTHKYSINVLYLFLSRQAMYSKCWMNTIRTWKAKFAAAPCVSFISYSYPILHCTTLCLTRFTFTSHVSKTFTSDQLFTLNLPERPK